MIRRCDYDEFDVIWTIINDGAQAYRGSIPQDCWSEPYMSKEELRHEMNGGVVFWGLEEAGTLLGIMGLQAVKDVTLIRHAYVQSSHQRRGIGAQLLARLQNLASGPVLIGTWANASWAIHFYQKHGFRLLSAEENDCLLREYWKVPERQIETSVVLADAKWLTRR